MNKNASARCSFVGTAKMFLFLAAKARRDIWAFLYNNCSLSFICFQSKRRFCTALTAASSPGSWRPSWDRRVAAKARCSTFSPDTRECSFVAAVHRALDLFFLRRVKLFLSTVTRLYVTVYRHTHEQCQLGGHCCCSFFFYVSGHGKRRRKNRTNEIEEM